MRAAAVLLVLSAAVSPLRAGAQTRPPDTPAGRQAAGWLEAFNAGSMDSLRRFLAEHAPAAAEDQRLLRISPGLPGFRERTGGFALRRIDSATATRIVALLEERNSDQMARLSVDVQAAPPHHITALGIQAVPRPPELAVARVSDSALVGALRERLEREVGADRFSGAVLVARAGRPLFEQAYGIADRERKVANTVDTRF